MTVAATAAKAGPYTGNDSASAFDFAFKVFADTDIRVVSTVIATGIESDLVLNTDYTVARNVDQDNDPGGAVTYKVGGVTTAYPSTHKLTIVGDFVYEQPTDIPNGGSFFATVVENALDRVTLLIKQMQEKLDRAVVVDVSDTTTDPVALLDSITASTATAVLAASDAQTAQTLAETAQTSAEAAQALAEAAAASIPAVEGVQNQSYTRFTAGGTADAITGTLVPAITAYTAGLRVTTTPTGGNTVTNPTMNLNAVGAVTIKKKDASGAKVALSIGDQNGSGPFDYEHDGTDIILLNPAMQLTDGVLTTVASAAAPNIWTGTGEFVDYTGTATATDFADAPRAGMRRSLICASTAAFTDGSGITISGFPAGHTYTAQAGEIVEVIATSATAFKLVTSARNGVVTPTLYNTTNISSSTAQECLWSQVKDTINFSGRATIVTSAAGNTVLNIQLPIPPGFTATTDCSGVFSNGNATITGTATANTTAGQTGRATLTGYATAGTTINISFVIQYKVKA